MAAKKNWIKKATSKNKGAFSASAKKAGMSTHAYAEKKKNAPGKVGKRARLALTLGKMNKKGGKKSAKRARK